MSINSSFHWEIARQNTVLEIAHSLVQLVSLGQNYTKLVQKFRLLLKIRWHFKDSNQRGNCVVVRLELLIQDTDTVPQLRVSNIFKAVQGLLISIERLVYVVGKQVTVTNRRPWRAIFWVDFRHLHVVLDCRNIVTFRSVVLSHFGIVLECCDGWIFILQRLKLSNILKTRSHLVCILLLLKGKQCVGLCLFIWQSSCKVSLLILLSNIILGHWHLHKQLWLWLLKRLSLLLVLLLLSRERIVVNLTVLQLLSLRF